MKLTIEPKGDIKTVAGWLTELEEIRKARADRLFFRGLSDGKHKLVPSVGRNQEYGDGRVPHFTYEQEKKLLRRFRRFAYAQLGRLPDEWEALFMARHHGLPTRLMDWSVSPLVALYFACSSNAKRGGRIWAFPRCKNDQPLDASAGALEGKQPALVEYHGLKPTQYDKVLTVYPVWNAPRIIAQGGLFTWHSNPCVPLDKYRNVELKENNLSPKTLFSWKVPWTKKADCLRFLEMCDVNRKSLYPDLDGLAAGLWQTEVLFHGSEQRK